ncbi:MAG: hypothetical protein IKP00_09385 [Victivallales bacterium]|nr:hypothetical protein [Victivallales bacterium]
MSTVKHYTKEELELYRSKEMPFISRMKCTDHLKQCVECASLLKELETEDAFVAELRESIKLFDELSQSSGE